MKEITGEIIFFEQTLSWPMTVHADFAMTFIYFAEFAGCWSVIASIQNKPEHSLNKGFLHSLTLDKNITIGSILKYFTWPILLENGGNSPSDIWGRSPLVQQGSGRGQK